MCTGLDLSLGKPYNWDKMQKGRASNPYRLPERFSCGEIISQTQPTKKKWQVGDVLGRGGFGLIYKAFDVTEGPADPNSPFVVKIEPLGNGPLFCELHFYIRAAKSDMIQDWVQERGLRYLGLPDYLGTGLHSRGERHYKFLVLQHLSTDLYKLFLKHGHLFPDTTVQSIGLRILDVLEYVHDKGYCHADIKAANILLGYTHPHIDFNEVYLVDYGLSCQYQVEGQHKPYKEDPKRAHDGTIQYASRDAHNGACPSRRGDVESLGYCMLEWLTGTLPWDSVHDKARVRDLKIQYMKDIPGLIKACFGSKSCPEGLKRYLTAVSRLAYETQPNYQQLAQCLRCGLDDEWDLGLAELAANRGIKYKQSANQPASPLLKIHPNSSAASPKSAQPHATPTRNSNKPQPTSPSPKNQYKVDSKISKPNSPTTADKIPGAPSATPASRHREAQRPVTKPHQVGRVSHPTSAAKIPGGASVTPLVQRHLTLQTGSSPRGAKRTVIIPETEGRISPPARAAKIPGIASATPQAHRPCIKQARNSRETEESKRPITCPGPVSPSAGNFIIPGIQSVTQTRRPISKSTPPANTVKIPGAASVHQIQPHRPYSNPAQVAVGSGEVNRPTTSPGSLDRIPSSSSAVKIPGVSQGKPASSRRRQAARLPPQTKRPLTSPGTTAVPPARLYRRPGPVQAGRGTHGEEWTQGAAVSRSRPWCQYGGGGESDGMDTASEEDMDCSLSYTSVEDNADHSADDMEGQEWGDSDHEEETTAWRCYIL